MVWETRIPAEDGNCTVKISPGLDNEAYFTTLFPNNLATNKNGSFPCGRKQGFDSLQFSLPENYVCDQCTLQLIWYTHKGNFFTCSDMTINGMKSIINLI
jgi:hypothetical protein